MFCGLVLSPSVRTSVAGLGPTTDGLNVTLTVQVLVAPKGILPPHVLVQRTRCWGQADLLGDFHVSDSARESDSRVRVFVSVTVFAALVFGMTTVAKSRLFGDDGQSRDQRQLCDEAVGNSV